LGIKSPTEADPHGDWFAFEKGAKKTGGGDGWADVWRRYCFAWEYKGKHQEDLAAALRQLQQYALALDNPPLLIVSDMATIEIHTNFTNTVNVTHRLTLDDLARSHAKFDLAEMGVPGTRAVCNRPGRGKRSLRMRRCCWADWRNDCGNAAMIRSRSRIS
jgi:hypothetical protein